MLLWNLRNDYYLSNSFFKLQASLLFLLFFVNQFTCWCLNGYCQLFHEIKFRLLLIASHDKLHKNFIFSIFWLNHCTSVGYCQLFHDILDRNLAREISRKQTNLWNLHFWSFSLNHFTCRCLNGYCQLFHEILDRNLKSITGLKFSCSGGSNRRSRAATPVIAFQTLV